jgi:hypothetical protein
MAEMTKTSIKFLVSEYEGYPPGTGFLSPAVTADRKFYRCYPVSDPFRPMHVPVNLLRTKDALCSRRLPSGYLVITLTGPKKVTRFLTGDSRTKALKKGEMTSNIRKAISFLSLGRKEIKAVKRHFPGYVIKILKIP